MAERRPALGFIFITLVIDITGIGLGIPVLPDIVNGLAGAPEKGAQWLGWLTASYALMQFLFSPLLGCLSDKYGRRPIILFSLLGLGLDYVLLVFANTLPLFFLGRIVAGFTGASITAASAYIADVSPPEKRAQNFGIIGAAFAIGFVVGPLLGGALGKLGASIPSLGYLGPRLPFMVAAVFTLANFVYGVFVLPESLRPENRREVDWSRTNPLGALLALKRYPIVAGIAGSIFVAALAHQILQNVWVNYTKFRYAWGPLDVGLSLAAIGLAFGMVQGGLTRKVIPWLGERKTIVFGQIINAIGFVLYGLAPWGWSLYLVILFSSLGAVCGPAMQGLISKNVKANEQGTVLGSITSLNSLAAVLGPIVGLQTFAFFIDKDRFSTPLPGVPFFLGSFLYLLALVISIIAMQRHHLLENVGKADFTKLEPEAATH
jgi:DHA1 family tetracycline resistance protein-like MFS transporter